MENPEEILHSLEEFSKSKPKDIPRELEEYLCFVAKTGDPVYQWSIIKSLFREKLISVITEFYESCPSVEIPPCPNVDLFNYDTMKTFILEKLDTFIAAPFTVQRICELLTTPRKEYNRIDKYMRALEKNILVVSTTEPGHNRTAENGDGFINGLESEHLPDGNNSNDINIEEMDDTPAWPSKEQESESFQSTSKNGIIMDTFPNPTESNTEVQACSSVMAIETVITCCPTEEQPYVSIEPVATDCAHQENETEKQDVSVTITAIPAAVQKRRDSIEPVTEQINADTEPPLQDKEIEESIVEMKNIEEAPIVADPIDDNEIEKIVDSKPIQPVKEEIESLPDPVPIMTEPIENPIIAMETIVEQPIIEQSIIEQPIIVQPIIVQPIIEQPIIEPVPTEIVPDPLESKQIEPIVTEQIECVPIIIPPIVETLVAIPLSLEPEIVEDKIEDDLIPLTAEIISAPEFCDVPPEAAIPEIVDCPVVEEVIVPKTLSDGDLVPKEDTVAVEPEKSEILKLDEISKIDEDISDKTVDSAEIETKIEDVMIMTQVVETKQSETIETILTDTVATIVEETPEAPAIVPEIQVPNPETPMDLDVPEPTAEPSTVPTD